MRSLRAMKRWLRLLDFRLARASFYRDLAEMYRRNESMLTFLEGEIDNARRTRQASRAHALTLMHQRYVSGTDVGRIDRVLLAAMPQSDRMLLAAVHQAPDKASALEALARAIEQQSVMRRELWRAAALPALIAPICIALIAIIAQVIVSIDESAPAVIRPRLWSGFNGMARDLAEFSLHRGPLLLILGLGGVVLLATSLPRWTGRARLVADNLPLYSLYRDYQAGMLFAALAMLLQSGISLRAALEDLADRAAPVMRWQLGRVMASLDRHPMDVVAAFQRGVLSPALLARVATLHRSAPSFGAVLIELGTREGERVVQRVRRSALVTHAVLVSGLAGLAVVMGMASLSVPAAFASLMQPTSLMAAEFEASQTQHAPATSPSSIQSDTTKGTPP